MTDPMTRRATMAQPHEPIRRTHASIAAAAAAACAAILATGCAQAQDLEETAAAVTSGRSTTASISIAAAGRGGDTAVGGGVLAAGASHTCVPVGSPLANQGGVSCWGSNQFGQLGGSTGASPGANTVSGLPVGVQAIAAGGYHTCALITGGVWCWGRNDHGQVGNPAIANSSGAFQVLGADVQAVAAGDLHTCALKNGAVWCWGSNSNGQLGPGAGLATDRSAPVQVTGLPGGVLAIAAGGIHTCALANGGAWCWGGNFNAQLGTGWPNDSSNPVLVPGVSSGVQAIVAGLTHTCALVRGGVTCWGSNSNGQLGNNTNAEVHVPVTVVTSALQPITDVQAIAAGSAHSCALVNGSIQCWGANDHGQLGNGATSDSRVAVTAVSTNAQSLIAGYAHTCALVNGRMQCWGNDTSGQLGDQSTTDRPAPFQIPGVTAGVQALEANGGSATCAIVNGDVQCWGTSFANGSATSSAVPIKVSGLPGGVRALAMGTSFSYGCAVANGGIWCWGVQLLGQPTTTTPTQVSGLSHGVQAIGAGGDFACALVNGDVWCWGRSNAWGQLGNGSNSPSTVPVRVTGLPAGAQAIGVGGSHSCALVSGGAWCWGANFSGQLGNGLFSNGVTAVPQPVSNLGSGVRAIAAGGFHTCAVATSAVACWGSNEHGQVGNNSSSSSPVPVVIENTAGVQSITAGSDQSCTLVNGLFWCWGRNNHGQAGNNTIGDRFRPVQVALISGAGPQAITAGNQCTCALINQGVQCWGSNAQGSLGDGSSITERHVPGPIAPWAP